MAEDDVLAAAKAEIRRREWASRRGKTTRTFIREHPEIVEEFNRTGDVKDAGFPQYVTRAAVLLELNQRARRRETTEAVRQWEREHPEEAAKIKEEARHSYGLPNSSQN